MATSRPAKRIRRTLSDDYVENDGSDGSTRDVGLFDKLPVETVESIVAYLELGDLCSLRAAGPTVAAKASTGRFRTHLLHKTIHLSVESATNFKTLLKCSRLACQQLQRLTVFGLVPVPVAEEVRGLTAQERLDRQKRLEEEEIVTNLLGQEFTALSDQLGWAFDTLKAESATGRLQSLSLQILNGADMKSCAPRLGLISFDATGETQISRQVNAGIRTFQSTMMALLKSKLPIEQLQVFGYGTGCTLPLDQFTHLPDLAGLNTSLRHVKKLYVSIADVVNTICHQRLESNSTNAVKLYTGEFRKFLALMPALEDLDLHWHNLRYYKDSGMEGQERFFFNTCYSAIPKTLRACTLRGINTTESALNAFFMNTSVWDVHLQRVTVHEGKFKPVIDTLTRPDGSVERFHLDDLSDADNLERLSEGGSVYFVAPGKPKYFIFSPTLGPSELIRTGNEVKLPLRYTYRQGRPAASPEYYAWASDVRKLFGFG